MAVNLSPVAGAAAQFFDNSGQVLTGGKLYTYLAGTTTPAATYTSSSGVTAQPNPIILNAAGRVPDSGEIWLSDSVSYKFVLKDQNDVLIGTYDNLVGINSNFINFTGEEETQTATQGQTVFTLATLNYQPATNNLLVFVNGSKQVLGTNFIETSSTVVTFVDGLNVGDVVDFCTATPINTSVMTAAQISYNEGAAGAITRTVQAKLQESVSVKDFGAVGNGTTNDTAAIQAALNSGAAAVNFVGGKYLISSGLNVNTTNQKLYGEGATISVASAGTAVFLIGFNGSGFVKTDNILIDNFIFIGLDTETSSPAPAIGVYAPTTNPYVSGQGCSNITVTNVMASGFTFGFSATAADNIVISKCTLGGMKYHPNLSAGGYGILTQTCFDIKITNNLFVGGYGDRHAIYISADPSRTQDSNNVCKNVLISGNIADWTNVYAYTGYELAFSLRGCFNTVASNNIIKSSYGGFSYSVENAPGQNISITGNSIDHITNLSNTNRGAIEVFASYGSYIAQNFSITGNTINLFGPNAVGIAVNSTQFVTIVGNSINAPNSTGAFGIELGGNTSNSIIGNNNVYMGNGYAALVFSGTNDKIVINKNEIDGANYDQFHYFTNPTNLTFGYNRICSISSNGSGTINYTNPPENIISSVVSDASGVQVTFQPWVNVSSLNLSYTSNNSQVGGIYTRTIVGQVLTIGVNNYSGVSLPASTNSYQITINVLS